jgi:hypothetical protein
MHKRSRRRNVGLHGIVGQRSFEPALSRLEQIGYSELWQLAKGMPEEWYECDREGLELYNRITRFL